MTYFYCSLHVIGLYNHFHPNVAVGVERLDVLVPHSNAAVAAAGAYALGENGAVYANVVETGDVEPEK